MRGLKILCVVNEKNEQCFIKMMKDEEEEEKKKRHCFPPNSYAGILENTGC